MLDLVKYLCEFTDEIQNCIDNKTLSEEAGSTVALVKERLYRLEEQVDENGIPSVAGLKWWFYKLRNLTDAYVKYHIPNIEKEQRVEAYTAITEALNNVSIGKCIYGFFDIKAPIYDLITVYNSLQGMISRRIASIAFVDDPKKIKELRDECLSIITTVNEAFLAELEKRTDDYAKSLCENVSAVIRSALPEGKNSLAEYYGDVDTSPDNATPKTAEDILELSEEARSRLKMLDEYHFSSVLHYPEGKLSDPQGGRAPIDPKISDKD